MAREAMGLDIFDETLVRFVECVGRAQRRRRFCVQENGNSRPLRNVLPILDSSDLLEQGLAWGDLHQISLVLKQCCKVQICHLFLIVLNEPC